MPEPGALALLIAAPLRSSHPAEFSVLFEASAAEVEPGRAARGG